MTDNYAHNEKGNPTDGSWPSLVIDDVLHQHLGTALRESTTCPAPHKMCEIDCGRLAFQWAAASVLGLPALTTCSVRSSLPRLNLYLLGLASLSCQELYSSLNVGGDAEGNRESLEIS